MNRTLLLISAVLLSAIAGVQTAMAQKVTLYMAGNQTYECDIAQLDSIVFSEGQTIPAEDIVVTVDVNGNADGGHRFTRIDETTFLIDDLKYKYENGGLSVIGYDPVFFTGTAKVISKLIYNGRSMDVVCIGNDAFRNCSSLTSVTIPNCVTIISSYAFLGCTSLTSITIPESVTSIGGYAFSGCIGLASITIPESVTNISSGAFRLCSSLTSITIPESVTSIGTEGFSGCTSLTSITIPNSVTSIGDWAFYNCSSLTSITIPESVTRIGWYAFQDCSDLTSVTIGNGVTRICSLCFQNCTSLTSITIGSGVTSIDKYVFRYCSSLTDVYCYAENVPSSDSQAFDESSVSSATLHVPAGSVDAYKATEPWNAFGTIVAIE